MISDGNQQASVNIFTATTITQRTATFKLSPYLLSFIVLTVFFFVFDESKIWIKKILTDFCNFLCTYICILKQYVCICVSFKRELTWYFSSPDTLDSNSGVSINCPWQIWWRKFLLLYTLSLELNNKDMERHSWRHGQSLKTWYSSCCRYCIVLDQHWWSQIMVKCIQALSISSFAKFHISRITLSNATLGTVLQRQR